ncbi:hypothetical protein HanPI659440_Chr00c11g0722971 [Helianthus annuus]|nr:hypothetical protein HanPI659440_Chr00c11g0722971 [Helianthus annuus]
MMLGVERLTRAGGEKGGDGRNEDEDDEGDEGEHPQVSLKRKCVLPTKTDPKPKQLKRKKAEFKTITLDDDDQVTEFSTAGGVLANLDAHLHGGCTPRDHLLKTPLSPLSFGGGGVKVVADVRTSDPKKTEPSPSGKFTTGVASNVSRPSPSPVDGGDNASSSPLWYDTEAVFLSRELGSGGIEDMDSARALEKYVPEWSLQELVSLRSQVERLKGQVSEAKEISKSSQASAAAAYEARDKALQDLEVFKESFADLEKKQAGSEERHAAEMKEMQTSYDQLLADYHRLISGTVCELLLVCLFYLYLSNFVFFLAKGELERARDRAVESHNAVIDEAKGMLTRCDGEMIELYAQVSELMLTKQWFLTEGAAWVVKLVQQSPELEKVVADLVNSVNAVVANEGIKQGFKAAHGSVCSAEEVPGYDAGAQDALDAAVKAFDELQISVLEKVADLIDKPLSVIQQRSKLPIVGEDEDVIQI